MYTFRWCNTNQLYHLLLIQYCDTSFCCYAEAEFVLACYWLLSAVLYFQNKIEERDNPSRESYTWPWMCRELHAFNLKKENRTTSWRSTCQRHQEGGCNCLQTGQLRVVGYRTQPKSYKLINVNKKSFRCILLKMGNNNLIVIQVLIRHTLLQ